MNMFTRAVLTFAFLPCSFVIMPADALAAEYRAFWVDAWGAGIHNQSQVETLLGKVGDPTNRGRIRDANCNAVIVQVRRRADVCYPSAMGEPYFSGLSPSDFNALQAIINAAHDTTGGKQRIEVHAWIVNFATSSSGAAPPANSIYWQHNNPNDPDNYWVTLDQNGNETSDTAFDPGHPRFLDYLTDVCMDLVSNFNIDGLHYDYVRFTANNQGYNPTSIARYNQRYGLTGQPHPANEQFKQWRRDQVTDFVRRVYAHVQVVKPSVKVSAAVVTWNPSPTSSTRAAFMATRPYYDVYSDWDAWMEEGILDLGIPMTYYNQASLPADYLRWMNFQKDRQFNRQNIVGPGIYLNSLSNAILQLQMTRDPSPAGNYTEGFAGYSYRVPFSGGTWPNFAPSLVAQVTPTPTVIPDMPWKTAPTRGHIMGTVTYAGSGEWADHTYVTLTGPESREMYVDGTGFYAFIDLPPGTYTVRASKAGYPDATTGATVAIGQVTGNMYVRDLELGGEAGPAISNVQVVSITDNSATVTWSTDQAASSQVEYGTNTSYGTLSPLDPTPVITHAIGLSGLSANTLYHFRVISGNENGTTTSTDYTFTTAGPPLISDVQATNLTNTGATITWTTSSPASSQVRYGETPAYGSQTPVSPTAVTSHSVALTNLAPNTLYHYQAVSANTYGTIESADSTFSTADMTFEIVIDNLDPGWANTSPSGGWTSGSIAEVPKIGPDYLYTGGVTSTNEANATRKCTWTPDIQAAGLYDVYVFYQIGANRTTSAPYKVVYDGGELLSIQNQYSPDPNQGGWFLIGENLPFAVGSAGYVQLSNNTGNTALVSADAARFVFKVDTTPPAQPVVTHDPAYSNSLTELHAAWEATDPESGIKRFEYRIREQGGSVIRDWTDAGTDTGVAATGLSLALGQNYFFDVRATNHFDLVSDVGSSAGIMVFTFDVNGDGLVDETDFDAFRACVNGPGVPYPSSPALDCARFDTDQDGDVDQDDFGVFQRCVSGSDPLNLACMDQ